MQDKIQNDESNFLMNDNIIGHKYDNAIRFLKRKLDFQSQDVSF